MAASIASGPGAERLDQPVQPLVQQARRALAGRQVPDRALEQVGAGVLHARRLGARDRVAAHEALVVDRLDDAALDRADVGDHAVGPGRRQGGLDLGRQRADRGAAEAGLGAVERLVERAGRRVDRAQLRGAGEPLGRAAEAGHLRAVHVLAGREPDRAADQADAEDRDLHGSSAPRRARTAAASPSSTVDGGVPVHALVGDRLAVDERLAGAQRLAAGHQERLEHHADDRGAAVGHLRGDVVHHARLALVVLAAVVVRGVHDHAPRQAGGVELLAARRRCSAARSWARRGRRAGSRGSRSCRWCAGWPGCPRGRRR